jgi:RNA polymerase sigma factor (sigma-70 family)
MGHSTSGENSCQKSDLARQIRSVTLDAGLMPRPTSPLPRRSASTSDLPTLELLDAVVATGYSGDAWNELARRLVGRALPDLQRSISTGTIYGRCARAGFGIKRREELQRHPFPEDVAAEAVEDCLERFRTRALPAGEWDPQKGTDLEDFFCVCCLTDLANRWRWHECRLLDHTPVPLDSVGEATEARVLVLPLRATSESIEAVELRELVAQAMRPMSPDDQVAFELWADGWSYSEIAQMLGISRNTLDVRISRARKAAKQRRAW